MRSTGATRHGDPPVSLIWLLVGRLCLLACVVFVSRLRLSYLIISRQWDFGLLLDRFCPATKSTDVRAVPWCATTIVGILCTCRDALRPLHRRPAIEVLHMDRCSPGWSASKGWGWDVLGHSRDWCDWERLGKHFIIFSFSSKVIYTIQINQSKRYLGMWNESSPHL